MAQLPMAYDVEGIRAAIAQGRADLLAASGANPIEDVSSALIQVRKLVTAKKVKHFAHESRITAQRTYEDHEAQLRAIDTLLDVYGVKAPRAQAQAQAMGVAIEIDPATGIVRVIAGTTGSGQGQVRVGDGT